MPCWGLLSAVAGSSGFIQFAKSATGQLGQEAPSQELFTSLTRAISSLSSSLTSIFSVFPKYSKG